MEYNSLKKAELLEELKNKDKKIDNIENTVAQLQQMMLSFMGNEKQQNTITDVNESVVVVSAMSGKEGITPSKDKAYIFNGYGSTIKIRLNECEQVMHKPHLKNLFVNGLLYFQDDKWYEFFEIKKPLILIDENLVTLLKLPEKELISTLLLLTDNRSNTSVEHHLMVRVAHIFSTQPEIIPATAIFILDKFFNMPHLEEWKIDNSIAYYREIAKIKR